MRIGDRVHFFGRFGRITGRTRIHRLIQITPDDGRPPFWVHDWHVEPAGPRLVYAAPEPLVTDTDRPCDSEPYDDVDLSEVR